LSFAVFTLGLGFNCGEAANFGTPQWLAVAKDAAVRRAAMDHLPMLCHQQLLYLLTMSFIPRSVMFSSMSIEPCIGPSKIYCIIVWFFMHQIYDLINV